MIEADPPVRRLKNACQEGPSTYAINGEICQCPAGQIQTLIHLIDETSASATLTCKGERCRRGRRLHGVIPHGHHTTVTLAARLRRRGLVAPKFYGRPLNAPVKKVLKAFIILHRRLDSLGSLAQRMRELPGPLGFARCGQLEPRHLGLQRAEAVLCFGPFIG